MKLLPLNLLRLISDALWNGAFIPLMLICALRLSVKCRALQFRALPRLFKKTIFSPSENNSAKSGSFQAASAAISSAVGAGNIVGTAQAITLGGPGALFWLWVSAFLGMIVKYAEVCLSCAYRGAPMAYIRGALHSGFAARSFALCAVFASFGIGNAVQVSCISDALTPLLNLKSALPVGIFLAAVTAVIFVFGTAGSGRVCAVLFPCMSFVFIFSALCVIGANLSRLPQVLALIVRDAFSPRCILGTGISIGFRRAAFSNEAGLGSAALAHSITSAKNPACEGLWGIFEVFTDTLVICSLTGISILCCRLPLPYGELVGAEVYSAAVASVLGERAAAIVSAAILGLFAFSSVVGWSMYGAICADYLLGAAGKLIYQLSFIAVILISCVMSTELIWLFADIFNALMSLPNLAALTVLADDVAVLTNN